MKQHGKGEETFIFTGKHMLAIMCLFFGVIISVNFTMASIASGSWTGLVVKNSYEAGQKYSRELSEAKLQQATGVYSDIAYENSELRFVLKDRTGKIIQAENMSVEIGRPAFEQQDQVYKLVPCRAMKCEKLAISLAPGVWFIKFSGQYNGAHYRRDARMMVTNSGKGLIE